MQIFRSPSQAVDIAIRLYLCLFMLVYGLGKFYGAMFDIATPEQLQKPMQEADLYHLTWYWFYRNTAFTFFIGAVQISGAILLLFRRTVILAGILLLPILLGIFMISIFCVGAVVLVTRVGFYLLLFSLLFAHRRRQLTAVWNVITAQEQERLTQTLPRTPGRIFLIIVTMVSIAVVDLAIFWICGGLTGWQL